MWYEKAHRATGHFMIIDTAFIPKALLDFTPALDDFDPNNKERPKWMGKRRNLRRFNDFGSQIKKINLVWVFVIPKFKEIALAADTFLRKKG